MADQMLEEAEEGFGAVTWALDRLVEQLQDFQRTSKCPEFGDAAYLIENEVQELLTEIKNDLWRRRGG